MDVVAHGLWAGVALAVAQRHWRVPRRTALATVGLAVAPDLAQLLPVVLAAALRPGGAAVFNAYIAALPGFAANLPPDIASAVHHLHCSLHSAVVAAVVSAAVVVATRSFWWPLAGWWSHIVIDVFTHSAEFFPSPVLYPFTQRGFDGLAWNSPVFLAANYLALLMAALVLLATRRRRPQ